MLPQNITVILDEYQKCVPKAVVTQVRKDD